MQRAQGMAAGSTSSTGRHGVTSVLVVADRRAYTELLVRALAGEPDLACAGSVRTVEAAAAARPDVVVVDIGLPGAHGPGMVRALRATAPAAAVVALTDDDRAEWPEDSLPAGADTIVPKCSTLAELITAVREAAARRGPARPPLELGITRREWEVLRLLGEGLTSADVAGALGISVNTCRSHSKSLRAKFGVHSTLAVVLRAQDYGLIPSGAAGHRRAGLTPCGSGRRTP